CPDSDGDGIADVLQSGGNGQNGSIIGIDTDLDGILDIFDLCPNTPLNVMVGIDGCEIDLGEGSGNSSDSEEDGFFESFFSGDDETVTKTVGFGAILLAIFALLQTNAIAGLLPETFRWIRILRRNNHLTREERNELTYLQSVIQAYHSEPTTLQSELKTLRGDLTARYTNNEIKKETREKLLVLIDDIMNSSHEQLLDIAYNDAYFGLIGTLDALGRGELLDEELAMSATEGQQHQTEAPSAYSLGELDDKGTYWLEWPEDSGTWYYRYSPEDDWSIYEN
ncbi:MAG: hypothetical protein L7T81_08255, partial [Candidatus Poseidoniaceae archaeon]|nr:hypothetical protein [Candidatus Poseidoniaceae archaeon]